MDIHEVCGDIIQGEDYCTFTVSILKYINKTNELKKKYPSLVDIRHINEDGSMVVRFPAEWFRFPSPPKSKGRVFTEEEKKANAERLRNYRNEAKRKMKSNE